MQDRHRPGRGRSPGTRSSCAVRWGISAVGSGSTAGPELERRCVRMEGRGRSGACCFRSSTAAAMSGSDSGSGTERHRALAVDRRPRRSETTRTCERSARRAGSRQPGARKSWCRRDCGRLRRRSDDRDRRRAGNTRAANARARLSTVAYAAVSACPSTWPPNTRRCPGSRLSPRNRSSSSRSRPAAPAEVTSREQSDSSRALAVSGPRVRRPGACA